MLLSLKPDSYKNNERNKVIRIYVERYIFGILSVIYTTGWAIYYGNDYIHKTVVGRIISPYGVMSVVR